MSTMTERMTAQDIVRTALEVEQTGKACYEEMKTSTQDPAMVELLDYLARDEGEHVQVFTKLFEDITRHPESGPQIAPDDVRYLLAVMKSAVFEGREAGIRRARQAKTPVEMLQFALQFERDSMLFWMKVFRLVREQDRHLIQRLLQQEEAHVADISQMLYDRQREAGQQGAV